MECKHLHHNISESFLLSMAGTLGCMLTHAQAVIVKKQLMIILHLDLK